MQRFGNLVRTAGEQLILWSLLLLIALAITGLLGSAATESRPGNQPAMHAPALIMPVTRTTPPADRISFPSEHACTDRPQVTWETGDSTNSRTGGPVCDP